MKRSRILITGLNGVIGWNLFSKARQQHEVYGTFRKRHRMFAGKDFHRVDLNDAEEVRLFFQQMSPDYIIHAWCMCDLDLCEIFPEMAYRTNLKGTEQILKAASQLPTLKKLVYISTDHVFNGEKGCYVEGDLPNPKHVYGRSKRDAETLVRCSRVPSMIVRPGLVVGNSAQGNKGTRDFLFSRIRANKPTHFFTDEWRTPISAEAFAQRVLELTCSDQRGVVHVAGDKVYSRYELAIELAQKHGYPTEKILPRLRSEDEWSHIRPRNLTLGTEFASV